MVAPFTGAWIEIDFHLKDIGRKKSLPSRERGLKYVGLNLLQTGIKSLPSRERGLK